MVDSKVVKSGSHEVAWLVLLKGLLEAVHWVFDTVELMVSNSVNQSAVWKVVMTALMMVCRLASSSVVSMVDVMEL